MQKRRFITTLIQTAAATAFGNVPRASGFGGPSKPQCESDSCTK